MPTYLDELNGLSLSEAIAEDAIGASVDRVKLTTFEMWHPSMAEPVRVVIDAVPLLATLEADAPRDPSTEVAFMAADVKFDVPEEAEARGTKELNFTIENVTQFVSDALEAARVSTDPAVRDATWQLIERVYMSDDTSAPHKLPVFKITLARVSMQGGIAQFTAAYRPSSNVSIPAITFTPEYYSGLLT